MSEKNYVEVMSENHFLTINWKESEAEVYYCIIGYHRSKNRQAVREKEKLWCTIALEAIFVATTDRL